MKTKRYTEWDGPAAARLHSATDLDLIIFGKRYTVKAFSYNDGTAPSVRIEFWQGETRERCLFGSPRSNSFRFSMDRFEVPV
jgi:hypothetical protein